MKRATFLLLGGLLYTCYVQVKSESCDIEIVDTLKTLLTPQEAPSIQLQALRRDILRKLQTVLDEENEVPKYPVWDLIIPNKRNLAALARGGYLHTTPEGGDDTDNLQRGLANLAKNNQLPLNNEHKRGIESLARNGELQHRQLLNLLDEYNKRNVGSLAKNNDLPKFGKRNIAALARQGWLEGKRNIAALLRQDRYMNEHTPHTEAPKDDNKRNIGSIKAQLPSKFKRQADLYDTEEYSPVYQSSYDYDDLMSVLNEAYANPDEKRFLGRLPQMGKPKTTRSPKTRYH